MKYIIIDLEDASLIGIKRENHLHQNGKIIINQNELINNNNLTGTLEERAKVVNGKIYNRVKIKQIIKKYRYGL